MNVDVLILAAVLLAAMADAGTVFFDRQLRRVQGELHDREFDKFLAEMLKREGVQTVTAKRKKGRVRA